LLKLIFTIYQQALRIYVSLFRIKTTEIIHKAGAAKEMGSFLHQKGYTRVLVITDNVLMNLGLLSPMLNSLKKQGLFFALYSDVVPNPTIANIDAAKALYTQHGCQAIVAFGGGSVIDCAKMTGVTALTGKRVRRYDLMIPMIPKMAPLIAVPTTAGTGSEVTLSAVVTDESRHKKMAITDAKLAPDVAVLDAELMVGLPKSITAATGIDALTHAVEAFVGNWKFKVTDDYAVKTVVQVFKYLKRAYDDGSDIEARHEMAIGATYGGYAFRTAGVGYVHGIAHRLSELYGVPHGLANAIVLPHVLHHSFNAIYKKLADLSKKAGLADASQDDKRIAEDFITKIETLNASLGIPQYADAIRQGDIPLIAKRAIGEANKTYPVPDVMTKKQMAQFVSTLMPPVNK